MLLALLLFLPTGCGRQEPGKPETHSPTAGSAPRAATAPQKPEPPPISGEITALLRDKVVEAKAEGSSIQEVTVRLRRLVNRPVAVKIPPGTFFVAAGSSVQNMVATEETTVTLADDEWSSVAVPAACANMYRNIPGEGDAFQIASSPAKKDLEKLAPFLAQEDYPVRQAAVWIVTDDADYDDLGTLVESSFSGIGGTRVITEKEAARAMKLLSDAGIDVKFKRIWQDRQQILEGLEDPGLKAWLAGY
ncbi:hypothetical protein [Thermodesulfitimonas autotrophica]|uniref:hypothetical protein n=1 Tax=Thermodesulfitimonas autotrophica TaxID=1894989 RepID=UPI002FE37C51